MKKLLLLLMTLMFLAPPGAQAETKTIKLLQGGEGFSPFEVTAYSHKDLSGSTTNRVFGNFNLAFDPSDATQWKLGTNGTYSWAKYNTAPTAYFAIGQLQKMTSDDIELQFDLTNTRPYNGGQNTDAVMDLYRVNLYAPGAINLYAGARMTVKSNLKDYYIKEIRFFYILTDAQKNTEALEKPAVTKVSWQIIAYQQNLLEEDGTQNNIKNDISEHLLTTGQFAHWNPADDETPESVTFTIPRQFKSVVGKKIGTYYTPDYRDYNADSSTKTAGTTANYDYQYPAFRFYAIEVDLEAKPSKPFVGIPTVYDKTSGSSSTNVISNGSSVSFGYGESVKLAFEKHKDGVINQNFFYYIDPDIKGAPLTNVNDIPADKWVKWENPKYLDISETCRVYYCAEGPDYPGVKGDMGYADFCATPQHTVFDFNNKIPDGKLKIWSESYPEGREWNVKDSHKNLRRMVFVPNKRDDFQPEAFIFDFTPNAEGNAPAINALWMYFPAGSKMTVRTQNGAAYMTRTTFDMVTVTDDASDKNKYLYFEGKYNSSIDWATGTGRQRHYVNRTREAEFTSTGNGGAFTKLMIRWEPVAFNNVAPEAPVGTNLTGTNNGGIIRFLDNVDVTLSAKQGNILYEVTTDATQTALGYNAKRANPGEKITITPADYGNATSFRVLMQSDYYTDAFAKSGVSQMFFQSVQAKGFDKLSEIITTANTGKEFTVTNNSPMQITGVYQTRMEGTTPGSTYYAYLADAENHAIKLVSQGEAFPATYKEGAYLPAGGFIGDFRYNYGSPEIVVSESYRGFLQPAVEGYIDGYDRTAPDLEIINTQPTDAQPITDFNRHVRMRHLKWLTGNMLEDPDGERYLLYSRLVVPGSEDPTTLTGDIISAQNGTYWCIEGYVGQVNGKTAIFPTAKVLRCPDVPVLLAPNPVEGDIVAISKTVNVKVRAEEGVKYFYSIGEDKHTDTEMPADGLDLTDANFTEGKCSLYVYAYSTDGEIWSTEPAVVNITKHTALEVASIEDFKAPFFNEDGSEKSELFGRGEISDDAIDPDQGISRYYQLTGEAIIVKRTPYYLYLRDYKDGAVAGTLNSKNYLLVYNGNQWNEPKVDDGQGGTRELRAGDVITGVALSPDLTELGNLRSNTTGFARTVTLLQSVDSTIVKPIVKEVGYEDATHDHYFSKVTVDNTNRMRYYTFEGVKVKHDDTTDEYTLDIATPVRMSFDIFSTRGGWVPAYSETGVYNITGVLIRDKQEGHFAIAPISFTGSGETPQPEVFLTENADTEKRSDAVQEGGHTVRFKMDMNGAGTIYYSVDGNNPLDNQNSRRIYTAGEEITLTFAEGQDRAVVMAFAAEPGKTPSAVVTRTFIKTSRELNYLLNFINQGEQDRLYHFNGHVAVAAVGGKWMMVRGSVGHYLPIYNADAEWDADAYKTGGYLTDFVIRYDKADGNIRGIAEAGRIFPAATQDKDAEWDEITFAADSVMHISADNARRLVKLHSARVAADVTPAAEGDNASEQKWTVTGGDHEGAPHRLAVGMLGETEGAETLEDGSIYDITGFVMLDAEGNAELWPVKVSKIAQTSRVSVKLNGQPLTPVSDTDFREYEASFSKGALVTLEVNDPRESIVIRYSYDDKTWYTYGEPFLVMESVEKIHAYAQAPGERASAHTHIQLTLKEASGGVEISSDNSTPGSATVTIVPAGTAKGDILYWTSKDSRKLPYTAPFTVNETMIVYAQLTADGKDDGAVSHSLVVVNPKNEEKPTEPTDPTDPTEPEDPTQPEQPGDRVSGRVKFELTDDGDGVVKVKISPEQTLTGEYEIWYTTKTGVTLPEGGTLYTGAFDMTESGLVMAVLVEKGKPAGQTCEVTVWVIPTPTAIDSVGADGTGSVRVDGDSIIAPEGSEVYDVAGRRVRPEGLRNGIYIVRTPDGNAVKVAIR